MTAEAASPKKQRGFPSAFTILALLLVVVAILTFIVPAGSYDVDADGAPIPGTYHTVEANPQRWRDAVLAPINGMYGIQDVTGYINVYNYRQPVRRHRRRLVHPAHRRFPGRDDEDRRHRRRH